MKQGDIVEVTLNKSPWKGMTGVVLDVKHNAGAINGWFTVRINDTELLFAGEEIAPSHQGAA